MVQRAFQALTVPLPIYSSTLLHRDTVIFLVFLLAFKANSDLSHPLQPFGPAVIIIYPVQYLRLHSALPFPPTLCIDLRISIRF